jgi:hypothetical protein
MKQVEEEKREQERKKDGKIKFGVFKAPTLSED